MSDVLILSSQDLVDLATPQEFVAAVEEGYRDHGQGASARPRATLTRRQPWGMLTDYTAILPGIGAMGGYLYGAGFGRKDAWFTLPLYDADTGELLAILDGAAINPLKTGAAGAVAIDHLATPEATTLALFGSGRQAWGQLRCAAAVRELEEVRVHSPTPDHRETFAKRATQRLGITVLPATSPTEALDGAGIVITATRSETPVFDDGDLEDGTHVTAMGQYHPERAEVPAETVARSVYVPDLRERPLRDAGAFLAAQATGLIDEDHIHGSLGEVVAGKRPGRQGLDEVTLFDSGGTGIETVAAAKMLYEKAKEEGLGIAVPFQSASEGMEDLRG